MWGSFCRSLFVNSKCRSPFLTYLSKARIRSSTRPTSHTQAPPKSIPTNQRSFRTLLRCSLFTGATVSGLCFGSVILEYELWRWKALHLRGVDAPPAALVTLFRRVRRQLEFTLGRPLVAADVFWVIVALNVLVFVGHRSPFAPFFARYFLNSPYAAAPALSMLLSVFSHQSLFHLAINMYVLHSFTYTLVNMVGPGEYITLFVSGGVFASLLSVMIKLAHRSPVLSLGSSGGICAVLGSVCMLKPETRLCVPFVVDVVPHSFPAYTACWVMLGLELAASLFLFSRSPIDHVAHAGGLMFGMFYGLNGVNKIWERRKRIISKWTEWRGR